MNTAWIARVVLASVLVYASAIALERVAGWFARPQRWIWLSGLAAAIALPVLAALAPASMPVFGLEPASHAASAPATFTTIAEPPAPPPLMSSAPPRPVSTRAFPVPAATRLWIAASTALLLIALSAAARLAFLRRVARPGTVDGVGVLITTNLGPLVTGLVSPVILIPSWVVSAERTERRLILAHEQQHIAGGDHWLIPLGALLVIAMPWNPAVWMMYARLRLAIETDCDARVIGSGADRRAYGAALIRVAGSAGAHTVLSPAWSNRARQLEHRVRAMTAGVPRRRALRSVLLGAAAMAMIAVAGDAATPDAAPQVQRDAVRPSIRLIAAAATTTVPTPTPYQTVPSANTPTSAIVTQPRAFDAGGVRVNGLTRREIRTRVHLIGEGARLVVLSGSVLRTEGDSIADVITPAEFGVVGTGKFQFEAGSLDPGDELEIISLRLDGERRITRLTTGHGTNVRVNLEGIPELTGVSDVQAELARRSAARDSARDSVRLNPGSPSSQSDLEPGEIRVTSGSGEPMRIQIRMLGRITYRGSSISTSADGTLTEATTPFTLKVAPNEDFSLSLSAPDSTQKFSVEAQGGPGGYAFGYLGSNYPGSTAICWRVGQGAAIGRGIWRGGAAEACERIGVK